MITQDLRYGWRQMVRRPGVTAGLFRGLKAWLLARFAGPVAPVDEAGWTKLLTRLETERELARVHHEANVMMVGLNADPFTGRIH